MPRIRVDLRDVDLRSEIHAHTPAPTRESEENVLCRLIVVARQFAVPERSERGAVAVESTGDQRDRRLGGGVVADRGGNALEFELRRLRLADVPIDHDLHLLQWMRFGIENQAINRIII